MSKVFEVTTTLLKQYSNNLTLLNLMGVTATQLGLIDDAMDAFKKTISINPNFAKIFFDLLSFIYDSMIFLAARKYF